MARREAVSVAVIAAIALWGAEPVPIVTPIGELGDQVTTIAAPDGTDSFGSMVTDVGDIDGDGFPDVAFLADWHRDKEESVAYVLRGGPAIPRSLDFARWTAWGIRLHAPTVARFPCPHTGLGDLDGDGYDDMMFRTCWPPEITGECPAYVMFGGPHLPNDIDASTFDGTRGIWIYLDSTIAHHENQRLRTFAAGDVNGDGRRDLIIGEPHAMPPGMAEESGIVYVIFGTDPLPSSIQLGDVGRTIPGCRITSPHVNARWGTGAELGYQMSANGDLNGDGIDDLALAARLWDPAGAVFVLFGRHAWAATMEIVSEDGDYCCIVERGQLGMELGQEALEIVDDFTGDGVPDLVAAAEAMYLISGQDVVPGRFLAEEIATVGCRHGSQLVVRALPDGDGDGLPDLVVGNPEDDSPTSSEPQNRGALYLLSSRRPLPQEMADPTELREIAAGSIVGAANLGNLGESVLAVDLNGDGRDELVVTEPGFSLVPPAAGFRPAIHIVPRDVDVLGALRCDTFTPKRCDLGGGVEVVLQGRGFDGTAEVYFGGAAAEIVERPDSQRMRARVPAAVAAGSVAIRVRRGDQECTYAQEFVYYDTIFPREVDVMAFGAQGCVVIEPRHEDGYMFSRWRYKGGEDITGDGLADVVIRYAGSQRLPLNEVLILHGDLHLPQEVLLDEDHDAWITTIAGAEDGDDEFGDSTVQVGDIDGDGVSELAMSAPLTRRVYVVFGGALEKGRVSVVDLVASGRGFIIEDAPVELPGLITPEARVLIGRTGDLNGDGLADFAVMGREVAAPDGSPANSIAFVLGRPEFPVSISCPSLPTLYSRPGGPYHLFEVEPAGDVDGDGYNDLLFSDRAAAGGLEYFLLFGREDFPHAMDRETETEEGGACRIAVYAGEWYYQFGGIGDQNGDGYADIAMAGSPCCTPTLDTAKGRLQIIYGGDRARLDRRRTAADDSGFDVVFTATAGYSGQWTAVTGGRDFNFDGIADILIADNHHSYAPPPSRAIVLFGGALEEKAGPLIDVTDCLELVQPLSQPQDVGNVFPDPFQFAGDVNGDGYEDLVAYDRGHAFIYYNPLGGITYRDFVRGDVNRDGRIDIGDPIAILQHLFAGPAPLGCFDAADANDDEALNIADPIALLAMLFAGGGPLPPPAVCGPDPDGDLLDCRESQCP